MPDSPLTDPAGDDDAKAIRNACIEEAIRTYEDAGISGLCHEERFEAAGSAMRLLDLGRGPRQRTDALPAHRSRKPDVPFALCGR